MEGSELATTSTHNKGNGEHKHLPQIHYLQTPQRLDYGEHCRIIVKLVANRVELAKVAKVVQRREIINLVVTNIENTDIRHRLRKVLRQVSKLRACELEIF